MLLGIDGSGKTSLLSALRGGTFATIGARVWARTITNVKARIESAKMARAEREILALAAQYEESMPSFAAELRAANARRNG